MTKCPICTPPAQHTNKILTSLQHYRRLLASLADHWRDKSIEVVFGQAKESGTEQGDLLSLVTAARLRERREGATTTNQNPSSSPPRGLIDPPAQCSALSSSSRRCTTFYSPRPALKTGTQCRRRRGEGGGDNLRRATNWQGGEGGRAAGSETPMRPKPRARGSNLKRSKLPQPFARVLA